MANNLFQEENHVFQFDFSSAIWATDKLHDVFQGNKADKKISVDFWTNVLNNNFDGEFEIIENNVLY